VGDWKKVIVAEGTSLRKALAVIDASGYQIGLVTDDKGRLVGTVTDGDIRRGLLRGIDLDGAVEAVINRRPVVAPLGLGQKSLASLMRGRGIRQLPVVDEDGRVVGLELLRELDDTHCYDNTVVIMAGGLGERLRPLTETCPKPMLRVGGRPLLEIIIKRLAAQGLRNIILSVNYMAHVIEDYFGDGAAFGVNISYLREKERLGTAGALSLLQQEQEFPFLVMNGDILTTIDFRRLLEFHIEQGHVATVCARSYEIQIPYGVIQAENNVLVDMMEKPKHSYLVNAGIYVFNPVALNFVDKCEYCDMPSLLIKFKTAGHEISVYPLREYWLDIGRLGDLERANGEVHELFDD